MSARVAARVALRQFALVYAAIIASNDYLIVQRLELYVSLVFGLVLWSLVFAPTMLLIAARLRRRGAAVKAE